MTGSRWEIVRWALWVPAVVVFILAPLAWGFIDLVPAGWKLFAAIAPESASELQRNGVDLVVWAAGQWKSYELYLSIFLAVAFLAATIGATIPGPHATFCCAVFRFLGWGAAVFVLRELSLAVWSVADAAAIFVSDAVPALSALATDGLDWLSGLTGSIGMAGMDVVLVMFVLLYGLGTLLIVRDGLRQVQEWLQSAFIGQVDPVFPRASAATAQACASARRKAINAYLNDQMLPPRDYTHVTFSNGGTPFRFVREYVERRQEIHTVDPLRAVAFLEVPRGSPIKAADVVLEAEEEVTGQYVRLKFETKAGSGLAPIWDPPEETLMLLLGRVVDAAILADQHIDAQRDDTSWKAMPFFDRIYVEYRPIPRPLSCFLGPILGNAMPARVVIETQYPDIFRKAMHGGKGKYGQFRGWFGIGIQIEDPNLPQDFFSRLAREIGWTTEPVKIESTPWFPAHAPCRRLKSRVAGGISGKLKVELTMLPPGPNLPAPTSEGVMHVMSSGLLADGCPSVASSLPAEPPTVARGGIANAPAMWLLPPRDQLHSSCQGICVRSAPGDTATILIDMANLGDVDSAASDIPSRFDGPPAVGRVHRRAWVGAFFDRDLRQGNRFPLAACSKYTGGGEGSRSDFRGAFVKPSGSEEFGGVFIARQGPSHAPNLLLPEPLFNAYMTHLPFAGVLATAMPQTDQPPFVPSPESRRAR